MCLGEESLPVTVNGGWGLPVLEWCSPPKVSLKIDAIELWYAAPEYTLEAPRLVHRSFDPPPAVLPRARGLAERPESIRRGVSD